MVGHLLLLKCSMASIVCLSWLSGAQSANFLHLATSIAKELGNVEQVFTNEITQKCPLSAATSVTRLGYTTTKTRRFRVRLAGFMNLKIFSLEIKWPILTRKRRVLGFFENHLFLGTLKMAMANFWASLGNFGLLFILPSGHAAHQLLFCSIWSELEKHFRR